MAINGDDPLVKKLVDAVFYSICEIHKPALSAKLKFFCKTCGGIAICPLCKRSATHSGHNVIETFICSRFPTLRPGSLKGWIDVSGICQFQINKHSVVFIKSYTDKREPPKLGAYCKNCFRPLLDQKSISFCSIKCKIEGAEKAEEIIQEQSTEELKQANNLEAGREQLNLPLLLPPSERSCKLRKRKRGQCERVLLVEVLVKSTVQRCHSFRMHPRKQGRPQRAPLY